MNYLDRINSAANADDLDMALALAKQWTSEEPLNHMAWSKLAFVYEIKDSLTESCEAVRQAIRLKPENPSLWFKLAAVEYQLENFAGAADSFHKCAEKCYAIQDQFYLEPALVGKAKCLMLIGNAEEARSILEELSADAAVCINEEISAAELLNEIDRENGPAFAMS